MVTRIGEAARHQITEAVNAEILRQYARDAASRKLAQRQASLLWTPPESRSGAAELALPDDPLVYTIEGMHVLGHNSLLAAQFKAGKTTLMLNLVRSLADGVPFLGHAVRAPAGRIALWNYEVDDRQYRQWFRRIGLVHPERVELLHLRGRSMPLHTKLVRQWSIDSLRDKGITVWVMDPAARAILGWPGARETENSNTAVAEFLDTLDQIKYEAGVHDLFVAHHTGRASHAAGQEHGRGATRWDDWPDVRQVLIKKEDGSRYFYANGRGVDVAEVRLAIDPETLRLTVAGGSRQQDRGREDALRVVDAVEAIGDGHTKAEVKKAMSGVANGRKDAALALAETEGLIEVMQEGRAKRVRLVRDHADVLERTFEIELVEEVD